MGRKKNRAGFQLPAKTITVTTTKSTTTVGTAIKDLVSLRNQGIILINQKSMQDIFTKSGAHAKSNEFQTHYWALNFRYQAEDNSFLDICIPTVYFNYEQEVTSAHIDFDLKDVKELSDKLEPIHHMKANQLLALGVKEKLEAILGVPLVSSPSNFNSIHRHPGSSAHQSFSGTDLTKTASEPGVVYPLASASLTPNFAGIMAIDSGTCNVAHYEYRIASGTLGTDLTYVKGRCAAIIVKEPAEISSVERIMGISSTASYAKYDNCSSSSIIKDIYSVAQEIYQTHSFEAFTDSVVEEHVKQAVRTNIYSNYYNGYNSYSYQNAQEEKFKSFVHRFLSAAELDALSVSALNDMYRGLQYLKTKNTSHVWYATKAVILKYVSDLQKDLGYTAENIYGPNGIKSPLLSSKEYEDMYPFTLKENITRVSLYLDVPLDSTLMNSFDKEKLLDKLESLRELFDKDYYPKFKIDTPTDTSDDFSLDGLVLRDDITPEQLLEVDNAKEIIANFKDMKFIDIDNVGANYTLEEASLDLFSLEIQYFGEPDDSVLLEDRDSMLVAIDFIQKLIASDIEDAKEVILKYMVLAPSKTDTTAPEKSINEMRKTLLEYGASFPLISQLSDDKVREMYYII